MKQLTTYNRAAAYLNSIFDLLNDRYFEGALSRPIITIQSTPKAYGHYTLYDAWSVDGDKGMREINIGAGTLARPIENVCATLLHEMCHYFNYVHGIKDCSRGGTYHNKSFKATAEGHGLCVEYSDKNGWAITSPSDDLLDFVLSYGLTDILMNRNEFGGLSIGGTGTHSGTFGAITPKPSSTRKYICPCCGNSVRATKSVNIACMDCQQIMICA